LSCLNAAKRKIIHKGGQTTEEDAYVVSDWKEESERHCTYVWWMLVILMVITFFFDSIRRLVALRRKKSTTTVSISIVKTKKKGIHLRLWQ